MDKEKTIMHYIISFKGDSKLGLTENLTLNITKKVIKFVFK